jgi:CrcB protein
MSISTFIAVFVGGGFGSLARFGTSVLIVRYLKSSLPIATIIANLLACVVLIWAVNEVAINNRPAWFKPLIIIGFCGGFSTFSTFSYETLLLLKGHEFGWAIANVLVSVLLCLWMMWMLYKSPLL